MFRKHIFVSGNHNLDSSIDAEKESLETVILLQKFSASSPEMAIRVYKQIRNTITSYLLKQSLESDLLKV